MTLQTECFGNLLDLFDTFMRRRAQRKLSERGGQLLDEPPVCRLQL